MHCTWSAIIFLLKKACDISAYTFLACVVRIAPLSLLLLSLFSFSTPSLAGGKGSIDIGYGFEKLDIATEDRGNTFLLSSSRFIVRPKIEIGRFNKPTGKRLYVQGTFIKSNYLIGEGLDLVGKSLSANGFETGLLWNFKPKNHFGFFAGIQGKTFLTRVRATQFIAESLQLPYAGAELNLTVIDGNSIRLYLEVDAELSLGKGGKEVNDFSTNTGIGYGGKIKLEMGKKRKLNIRLNGEYRQESFNTTIGEESRTTIDGSIQFILNFN